MASDANNSDGSESSGAEGTSDTAGSDEGAKEDAGESSAPKRKRTKSAELAAQIPKVGGDTSSLFSSWDSVLGDSGDKKQGEDGAPAITV